MARFKVSGTVLGLRQTPYDFTDDSGKRTAGTSRRLLIFDPDAVLTSELAVREDDLPKAAQLGIGELVTLDVDVRANGNKLAISFAGVCSESAPKGVRSAS